MSRYKSGYRLEHRLQKIYTQHGWLATRFPKSGRRLYPADVLALKRMYGETHIHLIECKNASKEDKEKKAIYIQAKQIQKLVETAKKHQARAMVAYSFPHQHARIVEANQLKSSGEMFYVEPDDGVPIKKFINLKAKHA
ncbi:MAG: hypothetical protein JSV20_04525 [Candidatus Bathyarchaeota archaeon]|nr:MAG: hypothetical protein JSV20_04525 [Candidatus Bathyarchaeota archaeon]